jgi:hypothetical protein
MNWIAGLRNSIAKKSIKHLRIHILQNEFISFLFVENQFSNLFGNIHDNCLTKNTLMCLSTIGGNVNNFPNRSRVVQR